MADVVQLGGSRPIKIGELARRAGKSTRAVRLYEEMGLLESSVRTDGGHRLYDESAVARLTWIDKLQLLGFTLPQIRTLLADLEDGARGPAAMERVRSLFQGKLDETRSQIRSLESLAGELSDSLRYLSTCTHCEPNTLFESCSQCDHEHDVAPPPLITGMHSQRSA